MVVIFTVQMLPGLTKCLKIEGGLRRVIKVAKNPRFIKHNNVLGCFHDDPFYWFTLNCTRTLRIGLRVLHNVNK